MSYDHSIPPMEKQPCTPLPFNPVVGVSKIFNGGTLHYKGVWYALHLSRWDWGVAYHVMAVDGLSYAECYLYDDSKNGDGFTLKALHVDKNARNNGRGLALQEIREQIAKELGCKYTYLFCAKGTFMRKWYGRRGYKYYSKYEDDKRMVWLRKKLTK